MADQPKKWGTIKLLGEDGNIFMIMGKCRKQMKQMGASPLEIQAFQNQVSSSENYDQALQVVMEWFEVE